MVYICACATAALPPDALISSMMSAASARPSPVPPYSVGMRAPSQPASVSERTNRSGYSPARSSSRQYSSGNRAQSARTAERIDSCSSVRPKSIYPRGSGKCGFGAFARVGTMKVRLAIRTTVPSCLMPRWRTVTMPQPGRERDTRASSTSESA